MSNQDGPAESPGGRASAEELVTSPSIVLLAVVRRIEAELGAALEPLDLTISRLGLLGHIAGVPGVSFSELARMSGVSVQSVHSSVKALVRAGLVRDATARAGSASTIELTEDGTRLLRAARSAVVEVDERLFGPEADEGFRRIGEAARSVTRSVAGRRPGSARASEQGSEQGKH